MKISTMTTTASSDPASWFWLIFINILLGTILFLIMSVVNIQDIARNWDKHRCNPLIMPFASLFGYNTSENFNYCISNVFKDITPQFTGPFSTILSGFISSMMTIVKSLNSFRLIIATLMGSITNIFQEMVERFTILTSNMNNVSAGINRLMGRMFAIFYAIIYMGASGLQSGINFTNTFLFNFLDTFCFDPHTLIEVVNKGIIHIKDVKVNDVLSGGQVVTAVYNIMADGQAMVSLPGNIVVSSNHYIRCPLTNNWIRADKHPMAVKHKKWAGGEEYPLICLDTNTHEIPIGGHVFSDYLELDSTDGPTMKYVQDRLNNSKTSPNLDIKYCPGLEESEYVLMKDGSKKSIKDIKLGEKIKTGTVYGIVRRNQSDLYIYKSSFISGSTLVWDNYEWKRVCTIDGIIQLYGEYTCINLLVLNSGVIETPVFTIRDLMELHSPDAEEITVKALISPSA